MTIMESAIAMNSDYVECSNTLGKINLFAEASYKEYEINLKEVALKVLKENGTEEDFDFLATEAAKGYIERAKKAVEKIIEAVKKFIYTLKERLIAMVTSATAEKAIDTVDAACKKYPKLRNEKVEYHNTDKQVGVLQQGIDKLRAKVAKVKAKGVASSSDIANIDEIKEDTLKKVATMAVVTTVTLATAINIFKECNSRSEIDTTLNEYATSECEMPIDEDTAKTAETASFYQKVSHAIAVMLKEKATKKVTKSTSLFHAIKETVQKANGYTKSENLEVQESTSIEDLAMFAYVSEINTEETNIADESEVAAVENVETESVGEVEGLDLDAYFDEICAQLFDNNCESTADGESENTADKDNSETNTNENNNAATEESITKESASSDESESNAEQCLEHADTELLDNDEETTTESESSYAATYMEQLEAELFGESSEETAVEDGDNAPKSDNQSLLDSMEDLLQ
jgi:hypothetical protein